jgi:hypothetical protein
MIPSKKISIKTLKQVLALVDRYQLDVIEIDGLKVTKSLHRVPESKASVDAMTQASYAQAIMESQSAPTSIDELDKNARMILGMKDTE